MAVLGHDRLGMELHTFNRHGSVPYAHDLPVIRPCGNFEAGGTSGLSARDYARIGYPLAEVAADGSAEITVLDGMPGRIDRLTCTLQLLYEVHDPSAYITPDVIVDFSGVTIEQIGPKRVRISGARGAAHALTARRLLPAPRRAAGAVCSRERRRAVAGGDQASAQQPRALSLEGVVDQGPGRRRIRPVQARDLDHLRQVGRRRVGLAEKRIGQKRTDRRVVLRERGQLGIDRGLTGRHPVHVAAHRVDLAIVGDEAIRVGKAPGRSKSATLEMLKRELSKQASTTVTLHGKDAPVTRDDFISATAEITARLRPVVRRTMRDAGLTPKQIDAVLLVGGASRMPVVYDDLRDLLGMEPSRTLDPDRVVALGAAVQQALVAGEAGQRKQQRRTQAIR